MISGIIAFMAVIGVLMNALLLFSTYAISKGNEEKGPDYFFVLNMAALNLFLSGVVIYGFIVL